MLYNIQWFFKNHVPRESALWKVLLRARWCMDRIGTLRAVVCRAFLPFVRITHLNLFESKVYSQNGEDGILEAIFRKIGTTNKFCVEFGVGDGHERNTRWLCEKRGWSCLLMDAGAPDASPIKKEFVTAENVNTLFEKYQVPDSFDLLSIDVDGNDYWIWEAFHPRYLPRVVVIEYNAKIPPTESKAVAYDRNFQWDGTDYFSASLLALSKLGRRKGYTLVGCERKGVNAFFVRTDLIQENFSIKTIEELYRPPRYGKKVDRGGWPSSPKTMIEIA